MRIEQLAGWVPIRFYWQQSVPLVDWCYMGEERFLEPFFDQTVEKRLLLPFNSLFRYQTSVDALVEWEQAQPGLAPSGFIFHMSRCGSTLITQMLATLPDSVVISEAPPVDAILRAPEVSDERRTEWLKAMVSALGQPRRAGDRYLFFKFDSWSVVQLPIIARAFPDVPWLFVYHDPVEVLASQLRRRGAHMVPGAIDPQLFGLDLDQIESMPQEEYCAKVLARICQAALEHRGANTMLIDYRALPEIIWSSVLDFFRVDCTPDDIERMRHAARFNAKNPTLFFVSDSAEKKSEAGSLLREMSDKWVTPLYNELVAINRS